MLFRQSLRSWLKEELSTCCPRKRLVAALIVLGGGTIALAHLRSEAIHGRDQINLARQAQLQSLQEAASNARNIALDWAQWDDTLRFLEGRNPSFIADTNIAKSRLFDGGGAMAILGNTDEPLLWQHPARTTSSPDRSLQNCLLQLHQRRSQLQQSEINGLCPGDAGQLYVGSLAEITNNATTVRSGASLAFLRPVPGWLSRIQPSETLPVQHLEHNLVPQATKPHAQLKPIAPALWNHHGQQMQWRQADLMDGLRPLLGAEVAEISGFVLLALLLRGRWMLSRRQERLRNLRLLHQANHQLRHSERELVAVLEPPDQPTGRWLSPHHSFLQLVRKQATTRKPATGTDAIELRTTLARRLEDVLESARHLALSDHLTGLPNRRHFFAQLERYHQQCKEQGAPIALLFIDVDHFKEINDTYGHAMGDHVLQAIAQELGRLKHPDDFLARLGGDEFTLLLHNDLQATSDLRELEQRARQQGEQIVAMVEKALIQPTAAGQMPPRIGISVGVAVSNPREASVQELIRCADLAMYQGKTRRRQAVSVFSDDGAGPSHDQYALVQALRQDLEAAPKAFRVLFQPISDASGRLQRVEALSRWQHPGYRSTPTDRVFALAEEHRLGEQLNELVLQNVFASFVQLRDARRQPNLELALNISPHRMGHEGLGNTLLAGLQQAGLQPERVVVEITEEAILSPSEALQHNLDVLRGAGVRLALDDFGTGYASLVLLLSLRPDEIKVDQNIVVSMQNDPVAQQIMRLLVNLAAHTRMELVAEGVEDQAVLDQLLELGVQRLQGYLLGEPVPWQALCDTAPAPRAA